MLAAELHLAGVTPLVLERLAEPAPQRKSRGVGPLAFEALERRGLGEKLAAYQPERSAEKARDHGSEKNHFAWIHKIDPSVQEEPDRRGALIWQPDLEAVLAEYAAELGVATGWRDSLEIVEITTIDHDHLSAALIRPDGAVAWACAPGRPSDTTLLRSALTTWLGIP
jgi:2-polyprenyl-6-methoxyphenol hydroxylase-like FAD-dependent oxidoreductase